MQKSKQAKKMTPEQLQGLLHLRRRGYVERNGKAYTRKRKHKDEIE
jgi:hypothetical protein